MESKVSTNQKSGWLFSVFLITIFMTPYWFVNHMSIDRYTINFILGEEKIPFIPWTFLIYLSVFFQEVIVIKMMPKKMVLKAIPYVASILFVSLVFFILIPIEYPRELYPADGHLIKYFRFIDSPGNCFPSLHVSVVLFLTGCFQLVSKSKIKKILMWIWAIAIVFSVLTTKQHYLIDIFGGVMVVLPALLIFRDRVVKKE